MFVILTDYIPQQQGLIWKIRRMRFAPTLNVHIPTFQPICIWFVFHAPTHCWQNIHDWRCCWWKCHCTINRRGELHSPKLHFPESIKNDERWIILPFYFVFEKKCLILTNHKFKMNSKVGLDDFLASLWFFSGCLLGG